MTFPLLNPPGTPLVTTPAPRRGPPWWIPVAAGVVLLVVVMGAAWHHLRPRVEPLSPTASEAPSPAKAESAPPAPLPALAHLAFPTPQTNLLAEGVLQPTASGRPDSGTFGSVRTAETGLASFHEGIDIAPVARDRRGKPMDAVVAAADGRVAYVNHHSGDSNYGIYVVLLHPDPVGEVYTLYAHLAEVGRDIAEGRAVTAGTVLGRMGHTPPRIIPLERAHAHFEVGLLANARFAQWMVAHKTKNPHGRFSGWNLLGCDPLGVFDDQRRLGEGFTFAAHLATLPQAFELVVPASHLPDYFQRYPSLWTGDAYAGPALVLAVSESGIPLHGRAATPEEAARCAKGRPAVLSAVPAVLGRNGKRLIVPRNGGWILGDQGQRWVDMLTY